MQETSEAADSNPCAPLSPVIHQRLFFLHYWEVWLLMTAGPGSQQELSPQFSLCPGVTARHFREESLLPALRVHPQSFFAHFHLKWVVLSL